MNTLKTLIIVGTVSMWHSLFCQVTTDPVLPNADQEITIIYDASLGSSELEGASKVYMHSGVVLSSETGTSWQNVVGNWGEDDGIGQMTQVDGETDIWSITINPRSYYSVASDPIFRIGMVFRNADGSKEGKSDSNGDIFVDLLQGGYGISLTSPSENSFLVSQNETIDIEVVASEASVFTLTINDVEIETSASVTSYTYTHTASESSGTIPVSISATNGSDTEEVDLQYTIRESTSNVSLPAGIVRGINYHDDDNSKVTLCLEAPLKSSVYVVGDFTDWNIDADYQMNKDGDLFWLEISGLTPNEEYLFQYMVDETIFVADPFSDKISDPEDANISSSIYPDLRDYPSEAYRSRWYYQRASVIETNRPAYDWQVTDFDPPASDNLVIYELLIRDFFGSDQRTYANLRDTLSYLADLGINAIQLMPITEFNGNESWGYNPTFMLAPDKSYGTREDLKSFIDEAHQLGIAVILDVVMNHQDIPGTYAAMYFDDGITADNPWFNVDPTHPFNVFFDFNHESSLTQAYLDSVNLYWIEEYKFDGYRYDLSKGFTQVNSGNDVGQWSSYDQSRIDLLKRMADVIWNESPDTYIILEHFADNSEEKELGEYGMMLWGNMNHSYNQLAMGYSSESNINGVAASERGWNVNNLVSYMESHDEERLMYRCLEFGNENSEYSTKDFDTAIERIKAVSSFFYTVPGPKMLWQFGELGFDYSINRCTDGSISEDCRLSIKPTRWSYLEDESGLRLYQTTQELIKLKTEYSLFQDGVAEFFNSNNLSRYLWITQNELDNPSDPSEMNALVVGNFDLTTKIIDVNFPHHGKWYHYFDQGDAINVSETMSLTLQPGEFRIYTDVKLAATTPELMDNLKPIAPGNLEASDTQDGIQLNWTNESSISEGIRVYRSTDNSNYELIAELGNVNSYLDESVGPDRTYDYYIATFTQVGERTSETIRITAENVVLSTSDGENLMLYPNPVEHYLNIETSVKYDTVFVRDLSGRLLSKYEFDNQIDLSKLSSGTYLVTLLSLDTENKTFKIIKK